jgi:hypothetical protein
VIIAVRLIGIRLPPQRDIPGASRTRRNDMAAEGDWHRQRRVTLADVAKRAHVSKALVSIVMRGAPGASPATREKVFAAARELG